MSTVCILFKSQERHALPMCRYMYMQHWDLKHPVHTTTIPHFLWGHGVVLTRQNWPGVMICTGLECLTAPLSPHHQLTSLYYTWRIELSQSMYICQESMMAYTHSPITEIPKHTQCSVISTSIQRLFIKKYTKKICSVQSYFTHETVFLHETMWGWMQHEQCHFQLLLQNRLSQFE